MPDARMILFGMGLGPDESAAHQWITQDLGVGVEFQGYQSQDMIRKVLREDVDIILHTSLEESFGMTVLDGMAQGVPCVGGMNSGAIPWLLDGGQCGVLVDIMSPQAIAQGLLALIDDSMAYAQYAQQAHARVLEMFTLKKVAEKYIATLAQIAKR